MWKLDMPENNRSMNHIDKAFTKKNGSLTYNLSFAEKNAIKIIYQIYDSNLGVGGSHLDPSHLSTALLNALKKGYNQINKKGRLKKLRDKLKINAKSCPCCGIGVPRTLDHHLPKEVYKVLSIYSRNLVPYCGTCNNLKRTVTGIHPNKRFIHPYFSSLPAQQFLFATVKLRGKQLKFELQINAIPGLAAQLIKQMEFMMEKVDLKSRLDDEFNNYFGSIAYAIMDTYKSSGKIGVKKFLEGTAAQQSKQFGINHWRHAVFQALSQHERFCDGSFYDPWSLTR